MGHSLSLWDGVCPDMEHYTMFKKLRSAVKFYATLIEWKLRRYAEWGMSIGSHPKEPLELSFSVDVGDDPKAPYRASLLLTAGDVLVIWQAAYLAKTENFASINFDFGTKLDKAARSAVWINQDQSKADVTSTIVICKKSISLEGLGGDFEEYITYCKTLTTVFNHFGLPEVSSV